MVNHVVDIEAVIDYIEDHLDGKLDLESVAEAVHYSKYHLHRMFTSAVGMTIHDYVQRRQLTEAAKLLVFSDKPIIEVAFVCGYESQQAFSHAFKSMYKIPPAKYRDRGDFYPLQLRFTLCEKNVERIFSKDDIRLAETSDICDWMNLMRLAIDGYPAMNEADYLRELKKHISEGQALVLRDNDVLVGAMAFSRHSGCIDFLGVNPQYRNQGIQKLFLDALLETYLPGREISMTTYRENDKADTGHRDILRQLGFAERELLVEFGYPTQRFACPPRQKETLTFTKFDVDPSAAGEPTVRIER
ncbi:MAG: GNAT family N-acetyltransferase [Eggerthellaceae bacterium]|nr:GNAT family N-acetyltransferase [Eggerthellaceae bacterium]